MNIIIFGAGAIGSLFGGLLSKNNNVVLVGRKDHVNFINRKGLKIVGLTKHTARVKAVENLKKIPFNPDIVILSVKAYDTEKAAKTIKKIIDKNTIVISLQNGLDNVEKMQKFIGKEQILVCITTHGSVFSKPGLINHTGIGKTIVGAIDKNSNKNAKKIAEIFNNAEIATKTTKNILKEIWIKAIINSSINPLTTIFNCKNGYLIQNPILEKLVERICKESTNIANESGYNLSYNEMLKKTREVITDTSDNFSSMLQSIKQKKQTEIRSINGIFALKGDNKKIDNNLNKIVTYCIKSLSYN